MATAQKKQQLKEEIKNIKEVITFLDKKAAKRKGVTIYQHDRNSTKY